MQTISKKTFDQERALYASRDLRVVDCVFDGPADGESAFKECEAIEVDHAYLNLRYPFWHDRGLTLTNSEMTDKCRAALWYSEDVTIAKTRLHGIKALRECADVRMSGCDVISPEFGWSVRGLDMRDTKVESEYFLMRSSDIHLDHVHLNGKYSFQYVEGGLIEDSVLDTKDAFWHAKGITVRNSVIKGEYLGWYSEGLTLINCTIEGTQPLCYCKDLKLIDCKMVGCDLAFEKSEVEAIVTSEIDSVKNPASGIICAPAVGELIMDDPRAEGKVFVGDEVDVRDVACKKGFCLCA